MGERTAQELDAVSEAVALRVMAARLAGLEQEVAYLKRRVYQPNGTITIDTLLTQVQDRLVGLEKSQAATQGRLWGVVVNIATAALVAVSVWLLTQMVAPKPAHVAPAHPTTQGPPH